MFVKDGFSVLEGWSFLNHTLFIESKCVNTVLYPLGVDHFISLLLFMQQYITVMFLLITIAV